MEGKELLNITYYEDSGVAVHFRPDDDKDLYAVCLAVAELITSNPVFAAGLRAIIEMIRKDKDFSERLKTNTIDLPDVSSILKS